MQVLYLNTILMYLCLYFHVMLLYTSTALHLFESFSYELHCRQRFYTLKHTIVKYDAFLLIEPLAHTIFGFIAKQYLLVPLHHRLHMSISRSGFWAHSFSKRFLIRKNIFTPRILSVQWIIILMQVMDRLPPWNSGVLKSFPQPLGDKATIFLN